MPRSPPPQADRDFSILNLLHRILLPTIGDETCLNIFCHSSLDQHH